MAQKEKSVIGFKIFVFFVGLLITAAILGGAWLINKLLLAPPLIVSFRLVRTKIETKFDIWHLATIFACMVISTLICLFGVYLSLPIAISLISNIIVGSLFAVITWKIQEIVQVKIDKDKLQDRLNQIVAEITLNDNFNTETCTEEELRARCAELGFSGWNTELAIEFFIHKTKQSDLADRLCINEKSVTTRKRRMKEKLNKM